jgi:hypothetical protein
VRLAAQLNKGVAGTLGGPSSYLMKSPPVQFTDDEAREDRVHPRARAQDDQGAGRRRPRPEARAGLDSGPMGLRVCLVTPFAWSRPHDVNEHVAGIADGCALSTLGDGARSFDARPTSSPAGGAPRRGRHEVIAPVRRSCLAA